MSKIKVHKYCPQFSGRGERLGFEDARGELFFEVLRILHSCKPKAFLLENASWPFLTMTR